jgi:hypothetical protein
VACTRRSGRGFYVDVGAGDPEELSVTRAFYELGWSGINVEPTDDCFGEHTLARARDTNLKLAAGREAGLRTLHAIVGTGLSTLDPGILRSTGLPAGRPTRPSYRCSRWRTSRRLRDARDPFPQDCPTKRLTAHLLSHGFSALVKDRLEGARHQRELTHAIRQRSTASVQLFILAMRSNSHAVGMATQSRLWCVKFSFSPLLRMQRTKGRAQAPEAAGDRLRRVQLRLGYTSKTQLPIARSLACLAVGTRRSVPPDFRRRKRGRYLRQSAPGQDRR